MRLSWGIGIICAIYLEFLKRAPTVLQYVFVGRLTDDGVQDILSFLRGIAVVLLSTQCRRYASQSDVIVECRAGLEARQREKFAYEITRMRAAGIARRVGDTGIGFILRLFGRIDHILLSWRALPS